MIRYLPGHGGESPADGFHAGGFPAGRELGGIAAAAIASIGLGVVVGPEAPLIALGGGLAVLAVRLARRGNVPAGVASVVAATGSFAAVSTLFGSPLAAAFLMMEAAGLGGATATMVLVPGLLGAGIGSLVFVGLGSWTGFGTFSLAVSGLPPASDPTVGAIGWAVAGRRRGGPALLADPLRRAPGAAADRAARAGPDPGAGPGHRRRSRSSTPR